jgi:hypothetical protein
MQLQLHINDEQHLKNAGKVCPAAAIGATRQRDLKVGGEFVHSELPLGMEAPWFCCHNRSTTWVHYLLGSAPHGMYSCQAYHCPHLL